MINVPPTSDHDEADLGTAAGVTDRGLRHQRNEDAMALGSEQTPDGLVVVAVVCDGVSSSARPDEASRAAVQAALPVLLEAVRNGGDLAEASVAAVVAGRRSVAGLGEPEGERSATTFVSAVAARGDVTLCWLGDSRAYWLAAAGSQSGSVQLTRDDSVAGGMVEAGLATEEVAMALPHAHVLTRWLGAEAADLDGDPNRAPHVEQYAPPGVGVVLVCSDGLWNYLPDAAELARLALPRALTDPLGAANDMVRFAVDAGGADNITAVLIPYPAPETS
ncbi:MAG TPA: protein phosphatase 2C domain-containing protein [Streptosporangiaceae bacterium]|nr:protein phosphatase 2C domain-containing protein [Streptosporangiaceae bacterium]